MYREKHLTAVMERVLRVADVLRDALMGKRCRELRGLRMGVHPPRFPRGDCVT